MVYHDIFIGLGDLGNCIAMELSVLNRDVEYEIKKDREVESNDLIVEPKDKLEIHTYSLNTILLDKEDYRLIILAGSIFDPLWNEARRTLIKYKPALMLSIGVGYSDKNELPSFQPYANECIVLPHPSLLEPCEIAMLVLQFCFIHAPWGGSYPVRYRGTDVGSIIGYDLGDTEEIFAGKIIRASKMKADKENHRQLYREFLRTNNTEISQAQAILVSFWIHDDTLTLFMINELFNEIRDKAMPDIPIMMTAHVWPDGEPVFMLTLFYTLG